MPCKGSILTVWNGGPARPASAFAAGARPATAWAGGARPVSEWAGCEVISLTSITPPSGPKGTAVPVMLVGEHFAPGLTITVSGTGITVTGINVLSETLIAAVFNISAGAAETARDVRVVQGGAQTQARQFIVEAAILPVGAISGPSFWMEADFGVNVPHNAGIVNKGDWAGRGIAADAAVYKDPSVNAPLYQSSGLFGTALPYVKFMNAEGLTTDLLASLHMAKSTTFIVGFRTLADANSALWFQLSSRFISLGIQDSAASIYLARDTNPISFVRESSYHTAGGWIPKNVRYLIRHEYGGSHATHKVFLNGVQVVIPSQIDTGVGVVDTIDGIIRLGWRDAVLPAFAQDGGICAAIQFPDLLPPAEIAAWEAYLQKWFVNPPPAPVNPYLGPITFAGCTRLQVTAGQNINVDSNSKNNTGIFPDYRQYICVGGGVVSSSRHDIAYGPTIGGDGLLVFRFPNPITSFKITKLPIAAGLPGGIPVLYACDDYTVVPDLIGAPPGSSRDGSIINYKKSVNAAAANNVQEDIEIVHAPGFKCVVVWQTTLAHLGGLPSLFRDPFFKLL